MNGVLLTTLLYLSGPGCEKDTDCKGDRICNDRVCSEPVKPTEPVESEEMREIFEETAVEPPAPYFKPAPPPYKPSWERPPRYTTETVHPYVGGGIGCLVMGTIGIGGGVGILAVYKNKLDDLTYSTSLTDLREIQDLSSKAPMYQAGSAILISSGIVLVVTGIILTAITEQNRVRIGQNGVLLRF